ncbi:MAG: BrnT family toxin [Caulobacteraceae bacterium]
MLIWDEAKRVRNLAKHGLDFADVVHFDFETALHGIDDRDDYGELREIAIGWCGPRLCFLVFERRDGRVARDQFSQSHA